jgi:hypothetical protein
MYFRRQKTDETGDKTTAHVHVQQNKTKHRTEQDAATPKKKRDSNQRERME